MHRRIAFLANVLWYNTHKHSNMDVRCYRIMRYHFLWRRFFYSGVGVLSSLIFVPLCADAGVVDMVRELFIRQVPKTIVIDHPRDVVETQEHGDHVYEVVEQVRSEDQLTTRTRIDLEATDAAWNEQEGSFTMVDETGAWMHANGKKAGEDLIARGAHIADAVMTYDRDGHPYAVWTDRAAHLFVSRWQNGSWRAHGTDAVWDEIAYSAMACDTAAMCQVASPQIIIDGDNMPIVAWIGVRDGVQAIFVVRWNGQAWLMIDGSDQGIMARAGQSDTVDFQLKMVRNNAGQPTVVTVDHDAASVLFTRWDGTQWVTMSGDVGHDTLFAENDHGHVQRVFVDYDLPADVPTISAVMQSGNVKHVVWRDQQWQPLQDNTFVTEDEGHVRDSAVAYDAQHMPVVAVVMQKADGTTELHMQYWDERWNTYSLPLTHGEDRVQIDFTDTHMPLVLCYGAGTQPSRVMIGTWTGVEIITLDGIAPGMDDIVSVRRGGVQRVAMIRDAEQAPVVAWVENHSGNLYTMRWNGTQWTAMDRFSPEQDRVATRGVRSFVLAATSHGDPALLWVQSQQQEDRVQYAFVPTVIQSPRTVQSHDVSGGAAGIVRATITADADIPKGARITYALSGDGGTTWHRVQRDTDIVFEQEPQGLRWRAQLYKGDAHRMPTLHAVQVTYHVRHAVRDGACGDAARVYTPDATAFEGALCADGVVDTVPQFPDSDEAVYWQCRGTVHVAECTATRERHRLRARPVVAAAQSTVSAQRTQNGILEKGSSDRCALEAIADIGTTAATMRISAGKAHSGTEMKFKAEAENVKTGERVFAKLYGTPASDGRVQMAMEDLQPNTAYRIKVKMLVGGTYVFCPTVRTTTTSAQ